MAVNSKTLHSNGVAWCCSVWQSDGGVKRSFIGRSNGIVRLGAAQQKQGEVPHSKAKAA